MNDAQMWACIIGGLALAWHAVNVWARLRAVRAFTHETVEAAKNGIKLKL